MRKIFLTITAICILSIVSFAQAKTDTIQQLQTSIEKLEKANTKLAGQLNSANSNIQRIEKSLSVTTDSFNSLKGDLIETNNKLKSIAENLSLQIQQTNEKASADLSTLSKTVRNNKWAWITAVLVIAILSVLLFGWLKKQLSKEKTSLSDQIKITSDSLREEQLKLDGQLIKLLDTQMRLMNVEKQHSSSKADEVDHTLALKVADEIIRIQKNLSNMEADTRGLRQLSASVERIQDNFKANGYEMVEMLNKPYDQGMKVSANFRPDDNLKQGEQIITRIIKPQVNFKGLMIQTAQVEVSVGE